MSNEVGAISPQWSRRYPPTCPRPLIAKDKTPALGKKNQPQAKYGDWKGNHMQERLERLEKELEFRHKSADAMCVEYADVPEDDVSPVVELAQRAGYADGFVAGLERAAEILAGTDRPQLRLVEG